MGLILRRVVWVPGLFLAQLARMNAYLHDSDDAGLAHEVLRNVAARKPCRFMVDRQRLTNYPCRKWMFRTGRIGALQQGCRPPKGSRSTRFQDLTA
jgi:hypothetical protein